MACVYLALGANLGDRQANLEAAILELDRRGIIVEQCSPVIETDPVGGPPQGKFLNAAIRCRTDLPPEELLRTTQSIERALGRVPTERNGPRAIDIDILFYDTLRMQSPELTIPHPRMHEREFVLKPLKHILPCKSFPVSLN